MKQADKEGHIGFHLYDTSRIETKWSRGYQGLEGGKKGELSFNEYIFYVEDDEKNTFSLRYEVIAPTITI